MTNANDVLSEFASDGTATKVVTPSTFKKTPMVFIQNGDADNIGAYFVGTFLLGKAFPKKDQVGKFNYFVEAKLDKTTASGITVSDGNGGYTKVDVKEGDYVSIFCPSRLYRQLMTLSPGTRFVAVYEGMKRPKDGGKKAGMAHHFAVQSKPGSLTVADIDYIKSKSSKKATDDGAAKPAAEEVAASTEADKAAAMKLLEE